MSGPIGRIVAKGKTSSKHAGNYFNIGAVWDTDWDGTDQVRLQNRAKDDSGNWDNYPVTVTVTMPDGSKVEITDEDFFINLKHAEDKF